MTTLSLKQLYDKIVQNKGIVDCDNFIIISDDSFLPNNYELEPTIKEIKFTGKIKVVYNPGRLFSNFPNLEYLDVDCWDVEHLISLSFTFYNCKAKEIKCSSWNISNCKYMISCFESCTNLEKIDLSNWDTKNVINMNDCFYNCKKLKDLTSISKWNVNHCNLFMRIFNRCNNLEKIDLSNWDNAVLRDVYFYQFFEYLQIIW